MKYNLTEDKLNSLISECIQEVIQEGEYDESIGGWLGKQAGRVGKWFNNQVNDFRTNKQQYMNGGAQTNTQPAGITQPNGGQAAPNANQVNLQQIDQAMQQLMAKYQQLQAQKASMQQQTNTTQQNSTGTAQNGNTQTTNDVGAISDQMTRMRNQAKKMGMKYVKGQNGQPASFVTLDGGQRTKEQQQFVNQYNDLYSQYQRGYGDEGQGGTKKRNIVRESELQKMIAESIIRNIQKNKKH